VSNALTQFIKSHLLQIPMFMFVCPIVLHGVAVP